ncbi:MAG: SdpI family protein [Polyangia bacterium]
MNRATQVLVVISFGCAALLYGALPDPVPTHFDLAGNANGWTAKPWGAFELPTLTLVLAALFATLRRSRAMVIVGTATIAFCTYLTVVLLAVGAGHHIDVTRALFAGIGVLFVVLGNFFGKLRRNGLVGIRTPWTLADDEVWLRTHRAGGPIFMAGGVLLLVEVLVAATPQLAMATVLCTALVPTAYSWFVHRSLRSS